MLDITALFRISYGIFLLGAHDGGNPAKLGGCLVNTVFQLTADPIRVGVSVAKANQTHDFITASGSVAVTVVGEQVPDLLLGTFGYRSGRDFDKYAGVKYHLDCHGNPLMEEGAVAHYSCKVEQAVDTGTHTLFICAVDQAAAFEGTPMTYNYYREVKKLKSSKYAPTYVK